MNIFERIGRSPHGERGLKYHYSYAKSAAEASLSSRRAWIEILNSTYDELRNKVALLTESVD